MTGQEQRKQQSSDGGNEIHNSRRDTCSLVPRAVRGGSPGSIPTANNDGMVAAADDVVCKGLLGMIERASAGVHDTIADQCTAPKKHDRVLSPHVIDDMLHTALFTRFTATTVR